MVSIFGKIKNSINTGDNAGVTILVTVMILAATYRIFQNFNKDKLLEKSRQTKAVLIRIKNVAVRSPARGTYKYSVGRTNYEYDEGSNFCDLKVGDTILIRYSIEDPSVARVVEKYYMKKYWHLKDQE